MTLEYQLCFKCHSSYTTLRTATAGPSTQALDTALEFNPRNASYHPVEAAGANGSDRMNTSLARPSAYRLWALTVNDTVRCTQCHGDPADNPSPVATGIPATTGDVRLGLHASPYRGILRSYYRDRTLNVGTEPYLITDYSLCFLCHSEDPFGTGSTDAGENSDPTHPNRATNFRYHSKHMNDIAGEGSSIEPGIDVPGAGQGNAICAECHFRLHSTATKVGDQGTYVGGVNFAPNVTGLTATSWQRGLVDPGTGAYTGNCTLTCHGETHTPESSKY
jgi:hypothetical protein